MVRKQSNQGNNRRNLRKAPSRGVPKPVSPNYRVDMMHHQLAAMKKDPNSAPYDYYTRQSEQPPRHPRGYHTSKPPPAPVAKQTKKGYSMLNIEVKEELYKKFVSKLKGTSKSPKEVMNQLISFYNMGKIKI